MTATPQSPNRIGNNTSLTATSVETGITATAGGGQSGAYAMQGQISRVDTVASAADSVALPKVTVTRGVPGGLGFLTLVVNNDSAEAMQLFGATPDTINGVATGTGVSIPAGMAALCTPLAYTQSTGVGEWSAMIGNAGSLANWVLTGNLTVGGKLAVVGSALISGAAAVQGALAVVGTTTVSGAATLQSTLAVVGATTISGAVAGQSTLNVTGLFTASGTALIGTANVKVGFHGTTGASQAAAITAVSTSALVLVSGAYGFATEAQATALITAINSLLTVAVGKGLIAS